MLPLAESKVKTFFFFKEVFHLKVATCLCLFRDLFLCPSAGTVSNSQKFLDSDEFFVHFLGRKRNQVCLKCRNHHSTSFYVRIIQFRLNFGMLLLDNMSAQGLITAVEILENFHTNRSKLFLFLFICRA